MFDNTSSVRLPGPVDFDELDRRRPHLYCTARPGTTVSPVALPLIRETFWADQTSPRERVRYRDVVTAATRLLKPQHPGATRTELRKIARHWVRDVLALPGSPLTRSRAEWEASRRA